MSRSPGTTPGSPTFMVIGPIVLILAAVPLICGQVSPRGPLGPGDDRSSSVSDDDWYRATRVAGGAFLMGGLIWLAAALVLPGHFDSMRQERETIAFIGTTAVAVAMVVSMLYVEGGSEEW
jgi:hypothetical protein